jgi:hypothetical protein
MRRTSTRRTATRAAIPADEAMTRVTTRRTEGSPRVPRTAGVTSMTRVPRTARVTWPRAIGGISAAVACLGVLVAPGWQRDERPDSRGPVPLAQEQAPTRPEALAVADGASTNDDAHAWLDDGTIVAVRRSAARPGMYGAHGVDLAPATAPCASRLD